MKVFGLQAPIYRGASLSSRLTSTASSFTRRYDWLEAISPDLPERVVHEDPTVPPAQNQAL
jgi:hypothetical protein